MALTPREAVVPDADDAHVRRDDARAHLPVRVRVGVRARARARVGARARVVRVRVRVRAPTWRLGSLERKAERTATDMK